MLQARPMSRCRRCAALLFPDWFVEGYEVLPAWHCSSCGDWTDATILQHRRMTVLPRPRNLHSSVYDPLETQKFFTRWRARREP